MALIDKDTKKDIQDDIGYVLRRANEKSKAKDNGTPKENQPPSVRKQPSKKKKGASAMSDSD